MVALMPAPGERTEEQARVCSEVTFQFERTLGDFFDRLHKKAQREGWSTQTVEAAIEHLCGSDVLDQWEVWRFT